MFTNWPTWFVITYLQDLISPNGAQVMDLTFRDLKGQTSVALTFTLRQKVKQDFWPWLTFHTTCRMLNDLKFIIACSHGYDFDLYLSDCKHSKTLLCPRPKSETFYQCSNGWAYSIQNSIWPIVLWVLFWFRVHSVGFGESNTSGNFVLISTFNGLVKTEIMNAIAFICFWYINLKNRESAA